MPTPLASSAGMRARSRANSIDIMSSTWKQVDIKCTCRRCLQFLCRPHSTYSYLLPYIVPSLHFFSILPSIPILYLHTRISHNSTTYTLRRLPLPSLFFLRFQLGTRDEQEGLFLNPTRPETFAFQTRPDGTRRVLNPTRPDFFKKFQTRPDQKIFLNETREFVK